MEVLKILAHPNVRADQNGVLYRIVFLQNISKVYIFQTFLANMEWRRTSVVLHKFLVISGLHPEELQLSRRVVDPQNSLLREVKFLECFWKFLECLQNAEERPPSRKVADQFLARCSETQYQC